MKKFKITVEDAKADLRNAATGPNSQHWGYAPAVMALLNSHDELLVKLGEMKAAQGEPVAQIEIISGVLVNDRWMHQGLPNGWHDLFTAPPTVPDDYFASLVAKARLAADKAMNKYPQPNYVLLKVAEEAGEVVQAGVHYAEGRMSWQKLEDETTQLLAMLIRLVTEGDQVNGITPPDACRSATFAKSKGSD